MAKIQKLNFFVIAQFFWNVGFFGRNLKSGLENQESGRKFNKLSNFYCSTANHTNGSFTDHWIV